MIDTANLFIQIEQEHARYSVCQTVQHTHRARARALRCHAFVYMKTIDHDGSGVPQRNADSDPARLRAKGREEAGGEGTDDEKEK